VNANIIDGIPTHVIMVVARIVENIDDTKPSKAYTMGLLKPFRMARTMLACESSK